MADNKRLSVQGDRERWIAAIALMAGASLASAGWLIWILLIRAVACGG